MVDPELDELKREFLTEAQDKVNEMLAALNGGRTASSLDRVAYIAHQLKGSGGSYGYQRISSEAAEIEKVVESVEGKAPAPESVGTEIQRHVDNLRDEIDRRTRELS
jgi:HPt (histidine-containing phosphotransfer) domain-containing protein